MSARAAIIGLALAALAAEPALAQSQDDPIDALLRRALPPDGVPDEPDTAAAGTTRTAPDPVPATSGRTPAPANGPPVNGPVRVDETGRSAGAPLSAVDLAYDDRIRASAAAARSFQGPMDGGWTLAAPGRELYAFQLLDRKGAVEGAWRDLRRPGALDASGFIEQAERAGDELVLHVAPGVVAVLHDRDGRWEGQLTEGSRTEPVSLTRRNP